MPNAQQLFINIQPQGRNQGATFKPPGRNISAYKRSPDMIFDTIEVNISKNILVIDKDNHPKRVINPLTV